ncbi:MAG: hypothetical protein KatS3mg076_1581 [Candidatus Binatia bacterium]|nr:MAG: hypothetical protein KatS3mg076_1581 [Candidatus Binatia bacterium]
MQEFARSFLFLFAQLSVGGLLALAIPPFHEVGRGFYKSTAAVYVGAGVAYLCGEFSLWLRAGNPPAGRTLALAVWFAYCVLAATYLASLWGERVRLRARAYAGAVLAGLGALAIAAGTYAPARALSVESFFYPLSFAFSAAVLGTVSGGMMLGHWYLIDPGLSLEPLERFLRLFRASLLWQALTTAAGLGLLAVAGSDAATARLSSLFAEHRLVFVFRLALSPLGTLVLAEMIRRTLLVPQTMAATGLFYIATLFAVVGEFLGRFLLFRTSLPL